MQEEYFTVTEVAERLKVTPQAVYKWIKQRKIAVVYVGADRRITGSAIEAFIKNSTDARIAGSATINEMQNPSLVAA